MSAQFQATFTFGSAVLNTTPVFRSSPANGQMEVPLNVSLRVRANRALNKLTVTPSTVVLLNGGAVVNASVALQADGQSILVVPAAPLVPAWPLEPPAPVLPASSELAHPQNAAAARRT